MRVAVEVAVSLLVAVFALFSKALVLETLSAVVGEVAMDVVGEEAMDVVGEVAKRVAGEVVKHVVEEVRSVRYYVLYASHPIRYL